MERFLPYLPELWMRTGEHLLLTGASSIAAILIGVPLGVAAARLPWLRGPVLGFVGILQTIPSLAMLALLLAVIGQIGALPAIIALTLYALLPIARNTLTGLESAPPEVIEAANAIGMTSRQRLFMVELPLAKNVIIAGVRTAAVIGVGIATLSAFIGAGGLGQFINRGLALLNTDLILLGAVPAAMLALIVDGSIQALDWGVRRRHPVRSASWRRALPYLRGAAVCAPLALLAVGVVAYVSGSRAVSGAAAPGGVVRIGSKNFTEQLILAELMAQLIESQTNLTVELRTNLGGTLVAHQALVKGEIDLYAEYSGTALTAILDRPALADPDETFREVSEAYRDRFDLIWLPPFGFANTYALAVRAADAEANGWRKISDLSTSARPLRAAFSSEFIERPDGLPGLLKAYPALRFSVVRDVDPAIMYSAIARGEADVISAFSTDGRIDAFALATLEDDRSFFPPYYPSPVIRRATLEAHPEIARALGLIAGAVTEEIMRELNYAVDEERRTPRDAVRAFLKAQEIAAQNEPAAPGQNSVN